MEKETSKTESRYNMNESNFVLLGDLQREAFNFMNVKKDLISSMDRWQSIKFIVESLFTNRERQSLDIIEKEFSKQLKFNVPNSLSTGKPMYALSPKQKFINNVYYGHRIKQLRYYIRKLFILLRQYKVSMTDLDKKRKLG